MKLKKIFEKFKKVVDFIARLYYNLSCVTDETQTTRTQQHSLRGVQEIFDTTELLANLDRNAVKVEHSVYDYVVYDSSTVEKPVAVALDNDPDVKMFFKIPSRFKIETPIGTYNPDWAVYLNKNGEEKLYFVLETKGDTSFMHLKTSEQLKIHCGKEHFKALDAGVELETATSWTELRKRI